MISLLAFALSVVLCASETFAASRIALAVAPLEAGRSVSSSLTSIVQSTLEKELRQSARIDLVDRGHVDRVLEELAFQQSGVTDSDSAVQIGKHLNVEMLLFGELSRIKGQRTPMSAAKSAQVEWQDTARTAVTPRNERYSLSLKVVDVSSNQVLWVDDQLLAGDPPRLSEGTRSIARRLAHVAFSLSPVEMILFPAGEFAMGSEAGLVDEQPPHKVYVDAFSLDRTEVSRAAYTAFAVTRGGESGFDMPGDHPIATVSWFQADEYCRSSGKRLPTEAEWEYAARGGEGRTFPWGDDEPDARRAHFGGRTTRTVPVDALAAGASSRGLLHMAGNVAEWVWDWWDPAYYKGSPRENPGGPAAGEYKVVRGGSWSHSSYEIRAAARAFHNPHRGTSYVGFRCARSADASPGP